MVDCGNRRKHCPITNVHDGEGLRRITGSVWARHGIAILLRSQRHTEVVATVGLSFLIDRKAIPGHLYSFAEVVSLDRVEA